MKKYEYMFIIKPDIEEDVRLKTVEKMKKIIASAGKVTSETDMGQKELAYEVKKYKSGFYHLFQFETTDSEVLKEIDRISLIDDNVIRHLIVSLD